MQDLPGVSYVMPVLNEAGYVESAVASILAQDYPGPTEIVLALGPSTDGTDAIVARLQRDDPRIQSVANPDVDIPIGLNRAIRASKNPIIARVDAHTELPKDYTRHAVTTLLDRGAANVGGIMAAVGRPGLQAAVARAYNSRLGLGGGAYHTADEPAGPAESAYLGVMRADALAEIGYFDESLRRGEDWELNSRFRAAGHLVWLDPALQVSYWPRSTWKALVQQFWATGVWRGELVRRLRLRNSPRFFAPPVLVLATGATLALTPLAVAAGGGALAWAAGVAAFGPAAYLALLGGVAVFGGGPPADRLRYGGVLAVMHYAWGAGFLVGITRGARDAVDTSRTPVASSPSASSPSASSPSASSPSASSPS
ncbi:glycosyltransferase family 2 protein [uncultured Jatrophihabitans sp.]|uniref:glycosyltransferase family 2 protein n=1 Tax=uncultured Jatrophihabitans sp. TaxID=1610747 RepID=UPI0035CA3D39